MVKMQQEMMAISQKIAALSMQIAGAGMIDQGMFDEDDDDDGELRQFILDNPPPEDKAKYLPLGALLLIMNGEPVETFAMTGEDDDWIEMLESAWDIKNVEQGKKMLASLLKGRHEAQFGEDYRKFKAGKENDLDEDSIEGYKETLESLKEECPSLLPAVKKCNTLLAWDKPK
jgi:hypothetical protein